MKLIFPKLTKDDVEVRVAQCSDKGVSLLLYKDARVDMRMLDDGVGSMSWQRRHEFKDGRLYCEVGIKDDASGEWVWKEDVGIPSNMESDKGQASDAFKRACFNWGIGRELYTAPRIWVRADCCNLKTGKSGKPQCYDRFEVSSMEVEDGRITSLEIANASMRGRKVFSWELGGEVQEKPAPSDAKRAAWAAINRYAELHNADPNALAAGVKKRPDFEDTEEFWQRVESEFLNEC